MLTGKEFVQKLFSQDAEEIEKTYSEGFEAGYEYAQREFAEKEEEKNSKTAAKIAGTGMMATGAAVIGHDVVSRKNANKKIESIKKVAQDKFNKQGNPLFKGMGLVSQKDKVRIDKAVEGAAKKINKRGYKLAAAGYGATALATGAYLGKKAYDKKKADKKD